MNDKQRASDGASTDFEEDRQSGNAALRELYGGKLASKIKHFTEHASLVDLMLLYDVLKTWGLFTGPESEESVLSGAMAELFRKTEPESPESEVSPGTAAVSRAAIDTATPGGQADPRRGAFDCVSKALDRSDRRCVQFLIEEFQRDAEDFLSSASPSEIAFMSSVFTLAGTDGDLIGYIFRALNMDADDLIGPDKPAKEPADLGRRGN